MNYTTFRPFPNERLLQQVTNTTTLASKATDTTTMFAPDPTQVSEKKESLERVSSNAKFRILVVEDDLETAETIMSGLREGNFACISAQTATRARYIIGKERPDLVVLDRGLPDVDGILFLEELREVYDLPVVVCSGASLEEDKLKGLGSGADDYVTKPFSPAELSARCHTVLRRVHAKPKPTVLSFGDIEVFVDDKLVMRQGESIPLTGKEFDLLVYMAQKPRVVVPRKELLSNVWGAKPGAKSEATVTEHIRRLRIKLGDSSSQPRHLKAVRGVGYRLIP